MFKMPKPEYTPEFRELAVKRVNSGWTIGAVARELGLVEQTLRNWVKAAERGKLNPPGAQGRDAGTDGVVALAGEVRPAQDGMRNPKICDGVLRERCAVKYAWIDGQRKAYPLPAMCATLGVSISGYQAWQGGGTPNRKRLTDLQMLTLIRAIHAEFKGAYGSPRMSVKIRGRGFPASKERVERLMRENNIRARHKRRFKATTDSKHSLPVAPNLLDRKFTPTAPNKVWTC